MALLNGDACCVLETTLQLVDFAFQVKHRSAVNGWLWFAFFMPAKARLMLVTGCLDNSGLSTCTSNFSPMSSSHVLLSILPDASPFHGSFGPMCFFWCLHFTCLALAVLLTFLLLIYALLCIHTFIAPAVSVSMLMRHYIQLSCTIVVLSWPLTYWHCTCFIA